VRVFDIGGPERPYEATDRVLTVPNLLSVGRIAVLPLVHLDIVSGRFVRALLLLVVIAASDWLDGYLARVLDQRTRLGAVLDPIGDRLVFVVVGVALVRAGLLPLWVIAVLLAREIVVLLVGLVLLRSGRGIPETSKLGKVATSGLLLSITGLVAAAALGGGASEPVAWLQWLALTGLTINLSLTYLATLGYARAAFARRS
jgi:cardiolipin synthase